MKAILVIDMPTECIECPFCRVFADDKLTETHCTWMATTNKDGINTRAEWCPLKPLPQKKEVKGDYYKQREIATDINELIDFDKGYNACLDEILGEKQ